MKEVEFILGHHINLKVQVAAIVTNIFGLSVHTYIQKTFVRTVSTLEKNCFFDIGMNERALTESLFSTFIRSSSSSNEEIYCFPIK